MRKMIRRVSEDFGYKRIFDDENPDFGGFDTQSRWNVRISILSPYPGNFRTQRFKESASHHLKKRKRKKSEASASKNLNFERPKVVTHEVSVLHM